MTSDKTPLGEDQIASFRSTGYLILPGFYDAGETAAIESWCDAVTARPEESGRHMVYYEDSALEPESRVRQRVENFTPFHGGFAELFTKGRMIDAVAQLLGEPACLFKEKINYKLPGGDGFKAHQDAQAGWGRYAPFFITALVSIDRATVANGCLEVVGGHHRAGLIGSEWAPLGEDQIAAMDFIPVPTEPGDAIFFDSLAPHRSAANLTDQQRRVLYVTYNAASAGDQRAQYFADKRASFPPDIERDPDKTYVFRV